MDNITIYCGSSAGRNPRFADDATQVGRLLAGRGLGLVYGGGSMGLMGAVGRAVREAGGHTCAVIPQFMVDRGWNDPQASTTIVTADMHERKRTMASMAIGVIALAGGIGTFEELTEIITWRQLGLFSGNIVLLNTAGYYDSLLDQIVRAIAEGFLPADHTRLFAVASTPEQAVELAAAPSAPLELQRKF